MKPLLTIVARGVWYVLGLTLICPALCAQTPASVAPVAYEADAAAVVLARNYLAGGDGARPALLEALQRMGWGVRNAQGALLQAPPAGADTGLALRDYELEELLWKPTEQPSVRLISVAQALAVPFEDADPEELAQDLIAVLRKSGESSQPQQRFWARFIVALGRVSPAHYDLSATAPLTSIPPDESKLKQLEEGGLQEFFNNPTAMLEALQPTPAWPADDPVLAPSPRPKRSKGDIRSTTAERDQRRMDEISEEIGRLSSEFGSTDETRQNAAQEKMARLEGEMNAINQRLQAAVNQQMAAATQMMRRNLGGNSNVEDEDDDRAGEARFLAEWRDQPLSLLQIALITRVLSADLRLAAAGGKSAVPRQGNILRVRRLLPLAVIRVAQVAAPAPTFSQQFSGAAGDIWAAGWGAYTGAVLEHHLPENKFNKGVGIANTLIAWFKTIMSVARQNITIDVENAPLVRTKTRSPGEKRTARAKVEIDFPKGDALKAIRAAINLSSLDLQLPDGGPVSGAKVVWRLPEGSYNTKYQTAKGGWAYKPEFAVVQFAEAGSSAAYISSTNDDGEATITLEGVPQRRNLSPSVRPYPRRAAVGVEVTIKVGNLTQDLNDAISTAMGGPISGGLSFIADMVLRTSFFFQNSRVFEVTDWKEPAWEGEFEITVTAAGSKREKGVKGGPEVETTWKMDRYMEGRLHTPEWEEINEAEKEYGNDGRHRLQVDGDSRYFRLNDASSSRTSRNQNRYEAIGPMQIQPPARNQLELFSRSEPSGSASLIFNGGFMTLELQPFFGAECIVGRSEQSGSRSSNQAGPQYLSLLEGVYPTTFSFIEPNDGKQDFVEGSKTFDSMGSLPYVSNFDAKVVIKYRLWKNGPPPKNKAR